MKTTTRRLLPLLALSMLFSCPGPATPQLHVARVGDFAMRDGWAELQRPGRLSVLVRNRGKTGQARMHFFSIPYQSHELAVQHLSRVARGSPTASRFETLSGWPALVRRQTVHAPMVGAETESTARPPRAPDQVAVTVMLAVGSHVVRAEGTTSVQTDARVADEMEAIGRSVHVAEQADAAQTERDLAELARLGTVEPPRTHKRPGATQAQPGLQNEPNKVVPALAGITGVEQETAASANGHVVVVGLGNAQTVASSDGGNTWNPIAQPLNLNFPNLGDGSVTRAGSGRFYFSFLSIPNGSPSAFNVSGCAITVAMSPDGIKPFQMQNHAVAFLLNGGENTPDQPHIASDPRTPEANPTDQLYVVYREIGTDTTPQCAGQGATLSGEFTPAIVCSADGGKSWTGPQDVNDDDHPRVGVGGDGSVYVAVHGSDTLSVCKFSSCKDGLKEQFCVDAETEEEIDCPDPGMDRCDGDGLVSPTIAGAGDGHPDHIFLSWASQMDDGHVGIFVAASLDGGQSWPTFAEVSDPNIATQRLLPWMCAIKGTAHVGWFDRGTASTGQNDLTRFLRGSATLTGTDLTANLPDVDVSRVADPQCASVWTAGADNSNDFQNCSTPPTSVGSGNGVPKYGDYNGIACAPDAPHVFATWGSGTLQNKQPTPGHLLDIFVDAMPCGGSREVCCANGTPCNAQKGGGTPLCDAGATCPVCGHNTEPCCDGTKGAACLAADLVCDGSHTCSCGGQSEPCCSSGNACNAPWLACAPVKGGPAGAKACAQCGEFGQPCCGGGAGSAGTCNEPKDTCAADGVCRNKCGEANLPCCNSPKGVVPPIYTPGPGGVPGYCLNAALKCEATGCTFSVHQPGGVPGH